MHVYMSLANMPISVLYKFLETRDPMVFIKTTKDIPTRHLTMAIGRIRKEAEIKFFPVLETFEWGIQIEVRQTPKELQDVEWSRKRLLWQPLLLAKIDLKNADWNTYWKAVHSLAEIKSGQEIPLNTSVIKFIEIINTVEWPLGNDYNQ